MQSNQISLPLQDDCKTRMDTEQCLAKQRHTLNSHKQWEVH